MICLSWLCLHDRMAAGFTNAFDWTVAIACHCHADSVVVLWSDSSNLLPETEFHGHLSASMFMGKGLGDAIFKGELEMCSFVCIPHVMVDGSDEIDCHSWAVPWMADA